MSRRLLPGISLLVAATVMQGIAHGWTSAWFLAFLAVNVVVVGYAARTMWLVHRLNQEQS